MLRNITPKTWQRIGGVLLLIVIACNIRRVDVPQPADAEVRLMQADDDIEVELFACEPMITNPAAIDVDSQGRVWVADIHLYRGKAVGPPKDRILVLEDTTGSGRADKCTVFAEGLLCPMSICVAGDKVLVATSPDLWVYENKNDRLQANGPPKKLLTGFGGKNHDHGAHSLVLGPDHKWWMSHGDQGYDVVGTDGSHIASQWGGVMRGELDGSHLENVALNFRNPYEVCVNSFGEAFCSDNDDDGNQSTRLCWLLEGGNYGWYGRPPFGRKELSKHLPANTPFREHWHFRGNIPGNVPATVCPGFGGPAGICFYEGDAFGNKFKNMPWHCDAAAAEVRVYPHEKSGSGFKGQQKTILRCGDELFRPVDVCAAPDGSLYVADWYDGVVGGHDYKNPEEGRIFRIKPKGKSLVRRDKPGPYDNIADAIEGLKSPNLGTQYLARERLLRDKEAAVPALKLLLIHDDPNFRARALWVLDRMSGDARKLVLDQLHNSDATFRAFAVRVLRHHGSEYAPQILAMADDVSPEVVREILLALRHLKGYEADETVVRIASRFQGEPAAVDRYLLEAINIACTDRKQYVYEALSVNGSPTPARLMLLQLLNPKASLEMVTTQLSGETFSATAIENLLTIADNTDSPQIVETLLRLATTATATAEHRRLALQKMGAKLSGKWQRLLDDPTCLAKLRNLFFDRELHTDMLALAADNRLTTFIPEIETVALAKSANSDCRVQAINALATASHENALGVLRQCQTDDDLSVRGAAMVNLVGVCDAATITQVLTAENLPAAIREPALDRLLQSTQGAEILLTEMQANKILPSLRAKLLVQGTAHPDTQIRILFERLLPAGLQSQPLGATVHAEDVLNLTGDVHRGEAIFHHSASAQCKNCHTANGQGGNVGPDLSVIGSKFDRAAILSSILDPSAAIAPEYVSYALETTQGQVFTGLLVEKNEREIVLKTARNEIIHVASADVEQLVPQKKSLMPDQVLRNITAQDAADLVAFLSSQKKTETVAGKPTTRK